MKKKLKNGLIVIIMVFTLANVAMAASGSFGNHYAMYDTNCFVKLVPVLDDKVDGGTAAHQEGGYQNYAYVLVKIGLNSTTYNYDSKYCYDNEWSGTASAGWRDSRWAQTYHLAQCYTCGTPADTITFTYYPRQ